MLDRRKYSETRQNEVSLGDRWTARSQTIEFDALIELEYLCNLIPFSQRYNAFASIMHFCM